MKEQGSNEDETTVKSSHNESSVSLRLSNELKAFYKKFDVDLTTLSSRANPCSSPYRFVRLNPRYGRGETLTILRDEVKNLGDRNCANRDAGGNEPSDGNDESSSVRLVPWLEPRWGFYALPADFSLSSSPCFRSGRIYGMDVSSGAGVAVLLSAYHDAPTVESDEIMDEEEPTSVLGDGNAKELRILDLCCSPGLKLLQMADFFHQIKSGGDCSGGEEYRPVKVVGVDISEHRLNVCKSIVHKFFIDAETSGIAKRDKENPDTINVQLYLQDGTTFGTKSSCDENNLIFDSRVAIDEMIQRGGKRKRMNKSARARERKRLRQIVLEESGSLATEARIGHRQLEANNESNSAKDTRKSIDHFDYVLVDAECSTDGSLKHMKERIKESSSSKSAGNDGQHLEENTMLTDPTKLAELVELQRRLIASGYRLLKDGGTLVYSTCSLSEDQNENVVRWLLQNHEDAFLVPLHFPSVQNTKFVADGSLAGTVRFYPNLLQEGSPSDLLLGDGFFVAKIRKRRK